MIADYSKNSHCFLQTGHI